MKLPWQARKVEAETVSKVEEVVTDAGNNPVEERSVTQMEVKKGEKVRVYHKYLKDQVLSTSKGEIALGPNGEADVDEGLASLVLNIPDFSRVPADGKAVPTSEMKTPAIGGKGVRSASAVRKEQERAKKKESGRAK